MKGGVYRMLTIVRDKNTVFPVKKQTFSHSFNLLPQTERSLTSDDI